jgi:hypothetical protein
MRQKCRTPSGAPRWLIARSHCSARPRLCRSASELQAGPVSATLENGALRWVCLGSVEVLRGIAFLVRDRNWGTPAPQISDLSVDQTERGFRVTFKALCRTGDGDLPWSAEIVGEASGTLRFTGTARPAADFVTNRTGFVIMHPLERVAGCPVDVTHVDGTKRRARFPDLVDPNSASSTCGRFRMKPCPAFGRPARMEGDAWEMEDHRKLARRVLQDLCTPARSAPSVHDQGGQHRDSDGDAQLLRGDAKGTQGCRRSSDPRRARSRRHHAHAADRPARSVALGG